MQNMQKARYRQWVKMDKNVEQLNKEQLGKPKTTEK